MAELRKARLRNLATAIAVGGLLAAGCSKAATTSGSATLSPASPAAATASPSRPPASPAAPAAPAGPVTIRYQNTAIDHTTEDVAVGTKVVWLNAETNGTVHNVTSGTVQGATPQPDGQFASPQIVNAGEEFNHAFTAPGTYHYYCALHPAQMQGTITVR